MSPYDLPRLYDLMFPDAHDVGEHYLALARRAPGATLELACGSGRVTRGLCDAGIDVTGLDLSEPMLSVARERCPSATFVAGDMRSFDLGRQFGLVFVPFNSLLHVHDNADLLALLACVRRHLTDGGRFAFDIFSPSVRILARAAGQRYPVAKVFDPVVGADLVVTETTDYDAATQIHRARWFYSYPDAPDALAADLHLRCIFPRELEFLLQCGGFAIESRCGDFTGGPLHAGARFQVVVARRSS